MRNLIAQFVVLVLILAPSVAQAQNANAHSNPRSNHYLPQIPKLRGKASLLLSSVSRSAATPRLPSTASSQIVPATCPPDGVGAVCGLLPVPLDWNHPRGAQIQIFFELFPHSNPGPAESAILANFGGPAVGTTTAETFFASQILFWSNLDAHDLLLIDDRGTGLSSTIDCADLQHDLTTFDQEVASCAAQLGNGASRYGSGDIARDADAVRAALGYDKVDYFGASAGGFDVTAYATRFGKHLRSVVLDAAVGTPAYDYFTRLQFRAHADPRVLQVDCSRSPSCAADHPAPAAELSQLTQSLRRNPVEGDAYDASGNLVHVKVDEEALLKFVVHTEDYLFIGKGEILAAGASLKQGDPAPLLRLGAEDVYDTGGDNGDPTFFSSGAYRAIGCADTGNPWDWEDSLADRREEYKEAVSKLPQDYFAPYSKSASTGRLVSDLGQGCISWERPTPFSPLTPLRASYPNVPTLVLVGDLDNRVPLEESNQVAALFPGSLKVTVQESGHYTTGYSGCADSLVAEFFENLTIADTSCASTPDFVRSAVGRFPLLARNARAAEVDPSGGNQIGQAERRVVTVAVAATTDAWQRSWIGFGDGVGLRSGTFHTDYGDTGWTTTLTGCSFSKDVAVTGTLFWGYDASFTADLTVSGAGTAGGTLHISGSWLANGPVGKFAVSGTLGGKAVAVLVPEA